MRILPEFSELPQNVWEVFFHVCKKKVPMSIFVVHDVCFCLFHSKTKRSARDWRDEPKKNDDRVADELIKGNGMIDCPVNIGVTSNCSQRPA